jgi:hypothetical protein
VNSSTSDAPSGEFERAVQRFQSFLANQGFSPNVVWIEPSDVVLTGGKLIYVHHSGRENARMSARNNFDQGWALGNGVVLKGLFPKESATYSFVWFPEDPSEAEYAFLVPRGVKLEINLSQTFKVVIIRSDERWHSLKKRYGGMQFMRTDLFR